MRKTSLRTLCALVAILVCTRGLLGQGQTFEGTLTILWGDPVPGTVADTVKL